MLRYAQKRLLLEQFQYGRDAAEPRARLGLDRPLLVLATVNRGAVILIEAALSFLRSAPHPEGPLTLKGPSPYPLPGGERVRVAAIRRGGAGHPAPHGVHLRGQRARARDLDQHGGQGHERGR